LNVIRWDMVTALIVLHRNSSQPSETHGLTVHPICEPHAICCNTARHACSRNRSDARHFRNILDKYVHISVKNPFFPTKIINVKK